MVELKVLPLDLKMKNPNNYQIERQPITDNHHGYFKPNYSPFFTKNVEVLDGDGGLLKLGRDYTLEGLMTPLVLKTGKEVKFCIFIKDKEALLKSHIEFRYHSVGNTGFPNSLLKSMYDVVINNGYWVDYEDQILGKPETFPALQHLHNIKTEVANWDTFIELSSARLEWLKLRRSTWETLQGKLREGSQGFDQSIQTFKDEFYQHEFDYNNPHQLVRSDFPLHHIMNAKLATINEDLEGVHVQRFTTPKGVAEVVLNKSTLAQAYLKGGLLNDSGYDKHHPSNLVRKGTMENTHSGIHGAWINYPELNINYELIGLNNKFITSQITSSTETVHTSLELPLLGFDQVAKTVESGILVRQSTGNNEVRYYPSSRSLMENTNDYVLINDQPIVSVAGEDWVNTTWVIQTEQGLYLLVRYWNEDVYSFSLFYTPVDYVDYTLVLTPAQIEFKYLQPNGNLTNNLTEFKLFHYVKNIRNEITHYHYPLDWAGKEIVPSPNGTLFATKHFSDKNTVLLKYLTSFRFPNSDKIIPIEISWEFDTTNRVFNRLNGNDDQTLTPTNLPEFKGPLVDLVGYEGLRSTGKVNDLNYYFKTQNNDQLILSFRNYGRVTPYLYSVEQTLITPIKDLTIKDYTVGFPNPPFTVVIPTPMVVNYQGSLLTIQPDHYQLKDYVTDYTNQTIYHYAVWFQNKFTSWFTTTPLEPKEDFPLLSTITTNDSGIVSIKKA